MESSSKLKMAVAPKCTHGKPYKPHSTNIKICVRQQRRRLFTRARRDPKWKAAAQPVLRVPQLAWSSMRSACSATHASLWAVTLSAVRSLPSIPGSYAHVPQDGPQALQDRSEGGALRCILVPVAIIKQESYPQDAQPCNAIFASIGCTAALLQYLHSCAAEQGSSNGPERTSRRSSAPHMQAAHLRGWLAASR